jgi:hypothetical protein
VEKGECTTVWVSEVACKGQRENLTQSHNVIFICYWLEEIRNLQNVIALLLLTNIFVYFDVAFYNQPVK